MILNGVDTNRTNYGYKYGYGYGVSYGYGYGNGKYYKNNQHVENINKTTQGSKIGSNQVFGDPKVSHNKRHMAHKHSNMQPNKPTQGSKVGSNQVFGEPAIIDAQHTR